MIFIVILLLVPTTATGAELLFTYCPNRTQTYTANSPFENNLRLLLESLSSKTSISGGFYNEKIGNSPDRVYGQALCRGDVNSRVCQSCVHDGSQEMFKSCKSREAIIWYDNLCQVLYSSSTYFSMNVFKFPENNKFLEKNVSNPIQFGDVLKKLMTNLLDQTAYTSKHRFATSDMKFSENQYIYGLQQCTRDISGSECLTCLESALAELEKCCSALEGGTVVSRNCNMRFELYPFFDATTQAASNKKSGKKTLLITVLLSASACLLALVLVGLCIFLAKKRRIRKGRNNIKAQEYPNMTTVESLQFDLGTIETATNKFSGDSKLGEGGFGQVFKGTLDNGQEIAVKRLSKSSGQGVREFKNEVLLVAKLQHRNLVRLLGFCLEGEETVLVYEYVPNKSLDYFLFEAEKRKQLDWPRRCTIIGGIARGILYLHEDSRLRVIHRDLKASNILLDANMHPKVSDFGMARMFGVDDQTQGNTRRIVGTYGYMAPEYAMGGLYSVKSDVFSFGVLLLEILTGRKNLLGFPTSSTPTLLSYAWELWNEGKVLELMDPLLKDSCSPVEFLRYAHIGLLCVQEAANNRPTMSSVVLMLKSESISLSKPERPAFLYNDQGHTLGDLPNCSVNGITVSDAIPR